MRIDKYLKNTRIIKRRPVAKEACEQGRVKINGKVAKAGDEVEINDIIDISFGNSNVKISVKEIKDHVSKKEAETLYEIL